MILKHVHLFGLLLLSLILASFLGKYINSSEGLENNDEEDGDDMTNKHTGGSLNTIITDTPPRVTNNGGGDTSAAATSATATSEQEGRIDGFDSLFDSILPAETGDGMEPFISPISLREGLANSQMGIPKNQIPPGQDHLYVLKSQVVPPKACPVCPNNDNDGGDGGGGGGGGKNLEDSSSGLSNGLGSAFSSNGVSGNGSSSKCPPCPACARCPEPSFDCKKVPNYSIGQNGSLSVPRPVLADFSQFGM